MERSVSFSEKSSSSKNATSAASFTDLRCHSASYVSSYAAPPPPVDHSGAAAKNKKASKSRPPPSSTARAWGGLGDPELQRRRRVAGYRAYGVERRVKGSLKSGVLWIKGKCTRVVDATSWW